MKKLEKLSLEKFKINQMELTSLKGGMAGEPTTYVDSTNTLPVDKPDTTTTTTTCSCDTASQIRTKSTKEVLVQLAPVRGVF